MKITLQRCKSNGVAYHHRGNGVAVVLLHGVGLCAESWYRQLDEFSKLKLYAVDLPGHGESDIFANDKPSFDDFVSTIYNWIDSVINNKVIVIGHSLGGLIALELAVRFPNLVHGVVAVGCIYERSENARKEVMARAAKLHNLPAEEVVQAPIVRWFGNAPTGDNLMMSKLCRQWLVKNNIQGYAAAYSVFANQRGISPQKLATLAMPALFITGSEDNNSSPDMSYAMAKVVPNGSSKIIYHARHLAQLTHADEVNSALRSFLKHLNLSKNQRVTNANI